MKLPIERHWEDIYGKKFKTINFLTEEKLNKFLT